MSSDVSQGTVENNIVDGLDLVPTDGVSRLETLSIIVPVFNEAKTLERVVARIQTIGRAEELILVDDGSWDETQAVIGKIGSSANLLVVRHPGNQGKGAALKTGFAHAKGSLIIVQDADLEYDPANYPALIEPILSGRADVVFGSRFLPGSECLIPRTTLWANRIITWLFNLATGQRLTDVETCYKVFRQPILGQIAPTLQESGFGIEIELAAKAARIPGIRIVEQPVRYTARTRREGKKIRWTDGLWALWCILKYR